MTTIYTICTQVLTSWKLIYNKIITLHVTLKCVVDTHQTLPLLISTNVKTHVIY